MLYRFISKRVLIRRMFDKQIDAGQTMSTKSTRWRSLQLLENQASIVGLPAGEIAYELSDGATGQALAVLDLAWPDGVQRGLSERACVLLNEPPETLATASKHGFRCFLTTNEFKAYLLSELLVLPAAG